MGRFFVLFSLIIGGLFLWSCETGGGGGGGGIGVNINLGSENISDTSVSFVWNSFSEVENYKLYRGFEDNFNIYEAQIVYSGKDTSFTDIWVNGGQTYYYKVVGEDAQGNVIAQSDYVKVEIPSGSKFILGIDGRKSLVPSGKEVKFRVVVDNADNVYGVSFEISYNSSIFDIDSVNVDFSNNFLGSNLVTFIHDSSGLLSVAVSKTGGGGEDGSGVLCGFKVKALSSGSDTLKLINFRIIDSAGNIINIDEIRNTFVEVLY